MYMSLKGKTGIGYDIIVGRDLVVQLGHISNLKRNSLGWGNAGAIMKES